ncbi:hypothetical protein LZG04_26425 [Saccharothrix sp. S26]|nr:hypothetical protein [Saccharothrix sp. S26]MCE6998307.1 hypothetical protein [Saccharothrix sp. S26]
MGRTCISQTRITDMALPISATVRLDDGTGRTASPVGLVALSGEAP